MTGNLLDALLETSTQVVNPLEGRPRPAAEGTSSAARQAGRPHQGARARRSQCAAAAGLSPPVHPSAGGGRGSLLEPCPGAASVDTAGRRQDQALAQPASSPRALSACSGESSLMGILAQAAKPKSPRGRPCSVPALTDLAHLPISFETQVRVNLSQKKERSSVVRLRIRILSSFAGTVRDQCWVTALSEGAEPEMRTVRRCPLGCAIQEGAALGQVALFRRRSEPRPTRLPRAVSRCNRQHGYGVHDQVKADPCRYRMYGRQGQPDQ